MVDLAYYRNSGRHHMVNVGYIRDIFEMIIGLVALGLFVILIGICAYYVDTKNYGWAVFNAGFAMLMLVVFSSSINGG